jgi:hypothetical protein
MEWQWLFPAGEGSGIKRWNFLYKSLAWRGDVPSKIDRTSFKLFAQRLFSKNVPVRVLEEVILSYNHKNNFQEDGEGPSKSTFVAISNDNFQRNNLLGP